MYQIRQFLRYTDMQRILVFLFVLVSLYCKAQSDTFPERNAIYQTLVRQSHCIITATVIEQGGRMRFEDGITYCRIRCVVNESFKGDLKVGDTINLEVEEYGNISLGGKFSDYDKERFCNGSQFTFFLEYVFRNRFLEGTLLQPVDDLVGAQIPSSALNFWLRDLEE